MTHREAFLHVLLSTERNSTKPAIIFCNPLPTPQSANKPNFTAPDGITTSVSSIFAPFYGTSAAAPDAAAVAALMLQANPSLTPAQLTALMTSSAVPLSGAIARRL